MAFSGTRRLVGLGFGAIQSGLFAYEAFGTGDYAPPLIVDVRADLAAGLRADSGHFRVNIAGADRVDPVGTSDVDPEVATVSAQAGHEVCADVHDQGRGVVAGAMGFVDEQP